MSKSVLPLSFYRRSGIKVAKELLGKYLVCKKDGKEISAIINEVEVYEGLEDLASHARFGKTKRNAPMFEEGGVWYVYLCYGVHEMLNIVVGASNHPAAILIRGAGTWKGPGKLTKMFGIGRGYNGKEATKKTGLWIEDRAVKISKKDIKATPRIGVHYAKEWVHAPLRFFIDRTE